MFLGREVSRTQDYSEETSRKIDAEVSALLSRSHARALGIMTERRDRLDIIAKTLLERETLEGRDVEEIVEHGRILSEEEREKIDRERKQDGEQDEATAGGVPARAGNETEGENAAAGDEAA